MWYTMMLWILRILGLFVVFYGGLTLLHPKSGKIRMLLFPAKLMASALTPFLALTGILLAFLGLIGKDSFVLITGLVATVIAVRYIYLVTVRQKSFDSAFGSDWPERIVPTIRTKLLSKRWSLRPQGTREVPRQPNIVYGTHVETGDPLLADLWEPPGEVPRSGLAVIFLHGSGWNYGDKDLGTRTFFRHLACQGHIIMDVAYTLAPKAGLHAMLADVKRAIAWLKENALAYGVNVERIILMGGSAGGQLALLAAYTPNHPELDPVDVNVDTSVCGVVSYYGPPDMRSLSHQLSTLLPLDGKSRIDRLVMGYFERRTGFKVIPVGQLIPNFLGGSPDDVPGLYALASPIQHIGPKCPPTLLIQGTHDFSGMTPDVRKFHQELLKQGVLSVYVELPDTEHGFDLFLPNTSPAAHAATYYTERFLALML
jgi:acetyl esterase/lipase